MRPDRARTEGGAVAVRLFWFVAVGGAATLVHVATVSLLVRWWGWPPILANVAGWFVAFGCSFAGHRQGTFAARAVDPAVVVTSLAVAVGTYVLSSRWAFRPAGDAAGPTR